jgi:hypothetical protein
MDGDDHGTDEPGPFRRVRRGPGRPPEWDVSEDELLTIRREIALEVLADLRAEYVGESRTVEWLLRELLARLRDEC